MVGLSSLYATAASAAPAAPEEKPAAETEASKDAEGGDGVSTLSCNLDEPFIGSMWVATGSCLGGSIRYRQRHYYAFCNGEFEWGGFFGPIICSNNPPQEQ